MRSFRPAVLLAALLFASPAGAELYKWVDERGMVNYSSSLPPAAGVQPKKVDTVAERVSVYSPDDQLNQAMKSDPARDAQVLRLERELDATQRARAADAARRAASQKAAYERCVADRRVDCDYRQDYAPLYYPYVVGVARGNTLRTPSTVVREEPKLIGVDNRPKVGIDDRPKVGVDERPRVGSDNRPPVGAQRGRTTIGFR